ncbi:hypothetical protein KVR01_007803 [Diaporthe batatas]|uniref:uncharacterized protein n=1 Tax=Diaporthe batatas TaxID=748121 RepID=UPI001D03DBF1|nr:uncharacterized protein KVR01_007803 [Diaporthe batatas]KAG8162038.1 hypothetical protein KVR01_007803 [Diaporthe batatas]
MTTPKSNSRRLDKDEKNVLLHLLQAPKLTNCDIARILKVDERTISRRRKQLRTLGHLSPERNVKNAEKLHEWQLERVIALLDQNPDLQLKDVRDFLQTEYDLTVTVSTISRQLSRANHARARRPGYKGKRPDLQPPEPPLPAQGQPEYGLSDPAVLEQPRQNQPPATSKLPPTLTAQQERPAILKCPYFAAFPQEYSSHPFCQNAWPTARDAKDHIIKQHSAPRFRCNRCMGHFDDNTALVLHHRAPQPCPLREWVVPEGVDEDQKDKLRRVGQGDEIERWKKMFRIIFPGLQEMPDHMFYDPAYFPAIDPALGALPQASQVEGAAAVAAAE